MEVQVSYRVCTEIQKAECCPDHIHMLVAIQPHMSVSEYMGYLKSKSSLMIFDRHANLKYKYGNRHFWCRGYYVDTVGKYETAIRDYIQNQLQDDIANNQIRLKEFVDPFTGEPVKKGNKRSPRIGGLPVIIVWLSDFFSAPLKGATTGDKPL